MPKKVITLFLIAFILLIAGLFYFFNTPRGKNFLNKFNIKGVSTAQPIITKVKGKTKVKYPQDYTIVLLGDSMIERMGNSDELRSYLKSYYSGKTFEVLNYGFGSTNILSVEDRLTKETFFSRSFRPILEIDFDMIIVESFGHNPLSQFPLEEGLKKQTEALDKIVSLIKKENPKTKVIFLATIAPNKRHYAEGETDLTLNQRQAWTSERIAYIKNHIDYAKSHHIDLVNVFEKSLNSDGDGERMYIDQNDNIHPSPSGIYLISEEIAKYIFENKLF